MRQFLPIVTLATALGAAFLVGTLVRTPFAEAQQAPSNYGGGTVSSNNRFLAATGSVGSGMSVLWLVDSETKRVLIYGTNNLGKGIELRAARNIEWDLRLEEYMDDSQYKAEDLKRLAEKQRLAQAAAEKEKEREKEPSAPPSGKDGQK